MYAKTGQQKTLWYLFLLSVVLTMAGSLSSDVLWMQWSILPISFGLLYICDLMFGDERSFLYEPTSYAHWRDATETGY